MYLPYIRSVARRVLVGRQGGEAGLANNPLVKTPFAKAAEADRKKALAALLARTPAQIAEEHAVSAGLCVSMCVSAAALMGLEGAGAHAGADRGGARGEAALCVSMCSARVDEWMWCCPQQHMLRWYCRR